MNGGEAEIADVIWPTLLVEQDVPVSPAHSTAIEVVDHRVPVGFAESPGADLGRLERIRSSLGKEQRLIGESLVYELDVVEHHLAAAPGFVPMKGDSP